MQIKFNNLLERYSIDLIQSINLIPKEMVYKLALEILNVWTQRSQIFLFGNGGSAGNAIHLANDFIYGVAKLDGKGIKSNALSANPAVITCLANDVGYEHIFSHQLSVLANKGDLVIALSGSGNSKNIINAINWSKKNGLITAGILGYDGGEVKKIVDIPVHIQINDMQISEDIQLVVGHMLMQWLYLNRNLTLERNSNED